MAQVAPNFSRFLLMRIFAPPKGSLIFLPVKANLAFKYKIKSEVEKANKRK